MKKISIIISIIAIFFMCSFACALDISGLLNAAQGDDNIDVNAAAQEEISNSNSNGTFKPATYLDTVATFDIPDGWVYEGVIFDEKYSQKKYTYIKNLTVSVLYGLRDLNEEVKSKMPFLSADMLLSSLSEQNFIDILASASDSDVVEKLYGSNKFYEFEKTQKSSNGEEIHSIVDMCIIDSNIFSFSYIYRDKKDAFLDYEKMLASFRLKNTDNTNQSNNEDKQIEVTNSEEPKAEIQPPVQTQPAENSPVENTPVENIEPVKEEVKNEEPEITNEEIKSEEVKEEIKKSPENEKESTEKTPEKTPEEMALLEPVINSDSGNKAQENDIQIVEDINSEIQENTTNNEQEENSEEQESIGVVISTNKKKSIIETVFSVMFSNPVYIVIIVLLVILEVSIVRIIRKRRKNKKQNEASKEAKTVDNVDKKD